MSHWTNPALLAGAKKIGPLTFRSKASASASTTTAAVVSKPAGTRSKDLLVAVVWGFSFTAMTAPAGWTLKFSNYTDPVRVAIFTKKADGAEPSTYAFTPTGSGNRIATVFAFSGGEGEIDVMGTKSSGSSTLNSVSPSLTALNAGILISTYGMGTIRTIATPPSGMTQIDFSSPNISSATYMLSPSSPGATGTKILVWGGGAGNSVGAISFQIK